MTVLSTIGRHLCLTRRVFEDQWDVERYTGNQQSRVRKYIEVRVCEFTPPVRRGRKHVIVLGMGIRLFANCRSMSVPEMVLHAHVKSPIIGDKILGWGK